MSDMCLLINVLASSWLWN